MEPIPSTVAGNINIMIISGLSMQSTTYLLNIFQENEMTDKNNEPATETDALLKLIEIGDNEIEKGEYQTAEEFFNEMKNDGNFSIQQAKENDLSHKQG